MKEHHWLKEHWLILLTGVVVGIATLVLTAAGNPKNMASASPALSGTSPVR